MYKTMKDELTKDNIQLLERLKAMGQTTWPGTDLTIDEVMIDIDRKSQNLLRDKFGYQENKKIYRGDYYFITINMPATEDESKFVEFSELVSYAVSKYKWLQNSIYTLEFYTAEGSHPHMHMVARTTTRRDRCIKQISTLFNIEPNFVDIKRYYGDGQGHINYIMGVKKDDSKNEYIEKDKQLRNKYNIEQYIDNLI